MLMETQNIHASWDAVAPAIRAARLVPPRRGWFHPGAAGSTPIVTCKRNHDIKKSRSPPSIF
jgi:hypothetical protein